MERTDNLISLLKAAGNSHKGITFINGPENETFLSYKTLFNKAEECLVNLRSSGVCPGDKLILQIENNQTFLTLFWASLLGKIIPVPLTLAQTDEYRLKLLKVREVLEDPFIALDETVFHDLETYLKNNGHETTLAQIKGKVIFPGSFTPNTGTAEWEIPCSEETAYFQFSSGSTGDPKGILLSHGNLVENIMAFLSAKQAQPDDSYLSWLPLTHDMGLIGWHLNPLAAQVNQYIIPPGTFVRNPSLWLEKISEHKVTVLGSPNFGFSHCLKFGRISPEKNLDLSCIRLIVCGAEHLSHGLCMDFLDKLAMFGLKRNALMPGYGLAEATLAVTVSPCGQEFLTHYLDLNAMSIGDRVLDIPASNSNCAPYVDEGMLLPGFKIRICDKADGILPEETVGHILLQGRSVASGYVNNTKATLKTFTRDGWLRTGDLGFIRNQRLVITGRSREVIIIGGMNYYPHDIERVAGNLSELADRGVAACGIYDRERSTEELVLFVIHKKDLEAFIPVIKAAKEGIARNFNLPVSRVIPLESIPRTTSGKVQRVKLAAMYSQGMFAQVVNELNRLLHGTLEKIILPEMDLDKRISLITGFILDQARGIMGSHRINPDLSLVCQGFDSLMAVELRNRIEYCLDITVPISWFRKDETLAQFAAKLAENGPGTEETPVPCANTSPASILDQLKELDRMSDDEIREMVEKLNKTS